MQFEAELVQELLSLSRGGSILCCGPHADVVCRILRERGVSSSPFELDERLASGQRDECATTVHCAGVLDGLSDDGVAKAAAELCRITKHAIVLTVGIGAGVQSVPGRSKEFWEQQFFHAGCRRHPLMQMVRPFEDLDIEQYPITLAFEKIPAAAARRYPLEMLAPDRDLHMDMLREPGRRSDAHIARYVLASKFIRPNDTVLDSACGLGYGAAILWDSSEAGQVTGLDIDGRSTEYAHVNYGPGREGLRFQVADVQDLSAFPSESFDCIVSFETLEHLPDPDRFVGEAARLLKPGGRFVGSVPNLWVDETGHDPSPYHLHAFSLEKLKSLGLKHFLLDEVYEQSAGGGYPFGSARRLRLFRGGNEDGVGRPEWWIISLMKDPVGREDLPYRETVFPAGPPVPHVVAFSGDYVNPWLVHSVFHGTFRARSKALLRSLVERIERRYPADSADTGGALCVTAYLELAEGGTSGTCATLCSRITGYLELPARTPHVKRWHISLRFVLAKLHLAAGDMVQARLEFAKCARMDFREFSAHLATKPAEASFWWGWISIWLGEPAAARTGWERGLEVGRLLTACDWSEVLVNPQRPHPFGCGDGLREFTIALDYVTRCANGIRYLAGAARTGALRIEDSLLGFGRWAEFAEQRYRSQVTLSLGYKEWAERLERQIVEEREQATGYRDWAERLAKEIPEERRKATANQEWAERLEREIVAERRQTTENREWAERLEQEILTERRQTTAYREWAERLERQIEAMREETSSVPQAPETSEDAGLQSPD